MLPSEITAGMPTKAEWQELRDNCNVVWTDDYNGTGVAGWVFTSKINGNSLFFPAAGYCGNWSVDYVGMYGYYRSTSWYSSSRRGACASFLGVSAWTTGTGTMGTRCVECASDFSHNERILRDYRGCSGSPFF